MSPKFSWDSFDDAPGAVQEGSKFNWDAYPDHDAKPAPDSSGPGAVQSAIEHFGNAASFGYLPQLQAIANQIMPDPSAGEDAKLRAQGFTINQPEPNYIQDRDANIKRLNQEGQNHPYASAAGSVAGALAGGAATSAVAPINAATKLGRVAQAVRGGAIIGAVANPGDTEGQVGGLQLEDRLKGGVTGGLIGGAGQGLVEGASSAYNTIKNLPASMQGTAEERAFKSAGAMLKDYRKAAGQDRINELGRYMLDNGLVKPGMSVQDIADAAESLKGQHGKAIDEILSSLDSAGASAPSHEELAKAVEQMALPYKGLNTAKPTYGALGDLAEDIRTMGKPKAPAAGALGELTGKGEEYLLDGQGNAIAKLNNGNLVTEAVAGPVTPGATVPSNPNLQTGAGTFKGAQDVKKFIADQIEKAGGFKALNPSEKNQALQDAYSLIKTKMEDAAGAAAQNSGDESLLKNYLAQKSGYRNATDIGNISKDYALRQKANNFFSLGDKLSAGAGFAAGVTQGDSLEERLRNGAIGAGAGLANKALRTYGTPYYSTFLDKGGQMIARAAGSGAGQVIGDAANSVVSAAGKLPTALAATEGVMSRPNFEQAALRSVAGNSAPQPKGEDLWAQQGLQKLGIKDQGVANRLIQDPKTKQLLIQASDLEPGSKAYNQIVNQIQKGLGNKK